MFVLSIRSCFLDETGLGLEMDPHAKAPYVVYMYSSNTSFPNQKYISFRSKIFFQTNETRNYRFRYAIRWLKHGYRLGLINTCVLSLIVCLIVAQQERADMLLFYYEKNDLFFHLFNS